MSVICCYVSYIGLCQLCRLLSVMQIHVRVMSVECCYVGLFNSNLGLYQLCKNACELCRVMPVTGCRVMSVIKGCVSYKKLC